MDHLVNLLLPKGQQTLFLAKIDGEPSSEDSLVRIESLGAILCKNTPSLG